MADPLDPFGLNARDPERDAPTGPSVPNMGGIPETPMSPAANLNPFGITPVAGDQGGRPAEPATPAGPVSPLPAGMQPTEPVPPPEGYSDTIERARTQSDAKADVTKDRIRRGLQGEGPEATVPMPTVPGMPPPIKMERIPTAPEMDFAQPGSIFETPIGTITKTPEGPRIQFNEAGIQKYKEAKTRAIASFGGYPLAGDPNAPLPPVEPGQPAFNPFAGPSGGWIGTSD